MTAWNSTIDSFPTSSARPRIPVAVVEDNPDERLLLERLLVRSTWLRCVGCYATGEEALKSPSLQDAQVVLMDIRMPGLSGTDCTRILKKVLPSLAIIIVTAFAEPEALREALLAGANGFLSKPLTEAECCDAIQYALVGGFPLAKGVMRKLIDLCTPSVAGCSLTVRENSVLEYMARGFGNKEIGPRLEISVCAVENAARKIYPKPPWSNRGQAVSMP